MAIQNEPSRISTPFADAGTKNVIPETMAQPSATAAASWQAGFPTVCSLPLSAGGIPPARNDFNGVFNQITQTAKFLQDGGIFAWDASTDYGANRLVLGSDGKLYWSVAQSGPNTGAGAVDPTTDSGAYWGQLPVTATDAAYASVTGGFVPWSSSVDYSASQIVLGSDGLIYTAKAVSGPGTAAGAKDPTADSGAYWGSLPMKTPGLDDDGNGLVTAKWVRDLMVAAVYVDPAGSDSNDGFSSSSPVKTFAKALQIAGKITHSGGSDAFIVAAPGTYSGNIDVTYMRVHIRITGDVHIDGSISVYDSSNIRIEGNYSLSVNGTIRADRSAFFWTNIASFSQNNGIIYIVRGSLVYINCNATLSFDGNGINVDAEENSTAIFKGNLSIDSSGFAISAGAGSFIGVSGNASITMNASIRPAINITNRSIMDVTGSTTITGTSANCVYISDNSVGRFSNFTGGAGNGGLIADRNSTYIFTGVCSISYNIANGAAVAITKNSFGRFINLSVALPGSGQRGLTVNSCSSVDIESLTITGNNDSGSWRFIDVYGSSYASIANTYTSNGKVTSANVYVSYCSVCRISSGATVTGTVTGRRGQVEACSVLNIENAPNPQTRIPGDSDVYIPTNNYSMYR